VYLTIGAVLKHNIGLHSKGVSLWVTAAQVKTEKSKRRPGKSAHVAVDVKPAGAAVHAATIRSKEVGSCYSRPKSVSSTSDGKIDSNRFGRPFVMKNFDSIPQQQHFSYVHHCAARSRHGSHSRQCRHSLLQRQLAALL